MHAGINLRDIAVVELLGGAGPRVGELLALKVGDLEIHDRYGRVIVRKGKHGGYRKVPLTKDVRQAMNAYLQDCPDKMILIPIYSWVSAARSKITVQCCGCHFSGQV